MIADDFINAFDIGKRLGINLRGAACDDDGGVRVIAARFADLAPAFGDGFVGDGASVDNDGLDMSG